MKMRALPTLSRLRQMLSYDSRTGIFRWIASPRKQPRRKGKIAGTSSRGYMCIQIDGVRYQAHRLAWLYMTGCPPLGELDHRNRKPSDNRWCNLRPATRLENLRNHSITRLKANGLPVGVHYDPRPQQRRKPYHARIGVHGREVSLGYAATVEEARDRYVAGLRRWFGDFSPV